MIFPLTYKDIDIGVETFARGCSAGCAKGLTASKTYSTLLEMFDSRFPPYFVLPSETLCVCAHDAVEHEPFVTRMKLGKCGQCECALFVFEALEAYGVDPREAEER